ncbi:MAG: cyclic nucleotide-binding domain-containing protein [Magnetococcus sp. DMHC-1]|nr:cyclic nucleotide-binding domain-containing protein [Magnetococcales bacterium]
MEFTPAERGMLVEGESFFVTYEANGQLIQEGNTDDALFIVIKGSVAITKASHPGTVLAVLGVGSIIGEMSFLTKQPRGSNVIAREETTVFRIDGSEMGALDLGLQLKIKDQLIKILVERITHMNTDLARQKLANQTLVAALAKFGADS